MASGEMVHAGQKGTYRESVCVAYPSRISCLQCGHVRDYVTFAETAAWDAKRRDEYFAYKFWLRADFDGHLLWAVNVQHLLALEAYVQAPKRATFTESVWVETLPRWLTSRKNRYRMLKTIDVLKKKAVNG